LTQILHTRAFAAPLKVGMAQSTPQFGRSVGAMGRATSERGARKHRGATVHDGRRGEGKALQGVVRAVVGATEAATNTSAELQVKASTSGDVAAGLRRDHPLPRREASAPRLEFSSPRREYLAPGPVLLRHGNRTGLAFSTLVVGKNTSNSTANALSETPEHVAQLKREVQVKANALSETPEHVAQLKREVQVKEREIDDLRSMCHEHESRLKQYQSESNQEMEALKLRMLEFEELLQAHTSGSSDSVSTQCWSAGQPGDTLELSSVELDYADVSSQLAPSAEASQHGFSTPEADEVGLSGSVSGFICELHEDVPMALLAPYSRPTSPGRNDVTNITGGISCSGAGLTSPALVPHPSPCVRERPCSPPTLASPRQMLERSISPRVSSTRLNNPSPRPALSRGPSPLQAVRELRQALVSATPNMSKAPSQGSRHTLGSASQAVGKQLPNEASWGPGCSPKGLFRPLGGHPAALSPTSSAAMASVSTSRVPPLLHRSRSGGVPAAEPTAAAGGFAALPQPALRVPSKAELTTFAGGSASLPELTPRAPSKELRSPRKEEAAAAQAGKGRASPTVMRSRRTSFTAVSAGGPGGAPHSAVGNVGGSVRMQPAAVNPTTSARATLPVQRSVRTATTVVPSVTSSVGKAMLPSSFGQSPRVGPARVVSPAHRASRH